MSHIVSGTLGALALATALAVAAPALAADHGRAGPGQPRFALAAPTPPPPPAFAGPSRRTVHSLVISRHGKLYLRGDVERYSFRSVVVQRKRCQTCAWERHEVVTTGRRGWFRSLIGAPRRGSAFWRAKVRASDGYQRSFSATWQTYY